MKRSSTFPVGIILLLTVMLTGRASAQTCVVPPPGLVSWWPGDGNADDIVSGFNGTLVNGATFAPGFVAEAFSFDGVGGGRNDRVDLPPEALDGLSDFTVDLWLNTTDNDGLIISGARGSGPGGADNEFILYDIVANGFDVWVKGTVETMPIVVNDGMWHHVAFARQGSTGRLFIDGALIDSRTFPIGPLVILPGGLLLGQDQDCVGGCFDPNQAFDGLIDELEIYNRALSAPEIQAIFDAGSAGKCKPSLFDRFDLQKASLKFFHPGLDGFHFSADFDLNENSDGIDPGGEDVTVSFGTYTETLSAGAFDCTGSDCVYESRGGPGISRATISDGFLEFRAGRVDLSDTANPVEISVQIGNDSGSAVAGLVGNLKLCGIGFELALLLPPIMWLRSRRRRRSR